MDLLFKILLSSQAIPYSLLYLDAAIYKGNLQDLHVDALFHYER